MPEAFELFEEALGLAFGVALGEEVGAKVAVVSPVESIRQIAVSNECLTAPSARLWPRRGLMRWYYAAG